MSIECVSSMSSRSRSSSSIGTYCPFWISKPRTISSGGTVLPDSLLTFSYPTGLMSRRSRKWKRSSLDSVAEYIRTGTLTSPNEIVPLQIGLMFPVYPEAAAPKTYRFLLTSR